MSAPPLDPAVVVGVLGAGTMGRGIAWVAAAAGHPVLLYDAAGTAVVEAFDETRRRLDREVEKGRLESGEAAAMLDRFATVDDVAAFETAGLVVEAIVEDLEVKIDVLRRVEAAVAPSCLIATNTSSLSVTAIAAGLERPQQVAGMHFFNPAPVMPLVEIVAGAATSPEVVATLSATAAAWGKTPVTCASTPGFIVNRVARPFYGEALRLLQEGVADAASIDAVVTGAGGFRMGPFRLMDLVGLDVNLAVSTSVYEQTYHDSRFAPNVVQRALVDAGRLGRKAGIGFYDYTADAAEPVPRLHAAVSAPAAGAVGVSGELGHASGLLSRLTAAGLEVAPASAGLPGLVVGDALLWPTDGRTAAEAAATAGGDLGVVALDLARDWSAATCVAVTPAAQTAPAALAAVAGVLQAAGLGVVVVGDGPGLVLLRIVAQLASVAADAVVVGVAAPEAIDTAMRLGTNYPQGPLGWADELGAAAVVTVLDNLRTFYGEDRYRASSLLRRAALTGTRIGSGGDG
jgi:3-hydroxybutyryl-CoA dehydrogenase